MTDSLADQHGHREIYYPYVPCLTCYGQVMFSSWGHRLHPDSPALSVMTSTTILDKRYGVPPVEPCQAGGALRSQPRKDETLDTGTARSGTSRWFQKGARKQGKRKRKENNGPGRRPQYNLSSHQQHREQQLRRKKKNISLNILQANICGGLHIKKVELAKLFKKEKIHVAMLQEARHKNVNYDIT